MLCKLYKTTSPKNSINKVLTDEITKELNLKDEVDILNPTFNLLIFDGIFNYNYAYVPSFHRYYFINGTTILTRTIAQLELKVDVLESWKQDILQATAHITKKSNANLYGAEIEKISKTDNEIIELDTPFSLKNYFVLTVSKGGSGSN